jgi:hypothetical protein
LIDVSEVLTVSVITVIALMMKAVSSYEASVNFYTRIHGATCQKTDIFILAAMRT